ncbi:MAG: hypothetical protein ACRDOM_04210 [Nocardioides sp.]
MDLPHVDVHAVEIDAATDVVWSALLETMGQAGPGAAAYARIIGCADHRAGGPRPLAVGSTVPGFRVADAVSGSELALEGSHRFSAYALIFRLDPLPDRRTQLRAETRAVFPGRSGAVYRAVVIGTGGHAVLMRRLLTGIQRRSERPG